MRLRAPAGVGETVVEGVRVKPDKNGIVDVDAQIGARLVEVFGFADPKAKPVSADLAQSAAADAEKLHAAAFGVLKAFDTAIAVGAPAAAVAAALAELPGRINAAMIDAIKRAEAAVAAQSADKIAALTERAERAESNAVSLAEQLAAAASAEREPAKSGA